MIIRSVCIVLLLAATNTYAQNVTFNYDNAGNRTERNITLSKSSEASEEVTTLSDKITEKAFSIYPNPTQGFLSVEIKGYHEETPAEFRITNMSGRTILNRKATAILQTFDLSRQAPGIYLLQISINGEATVLKIVKQ